MRSAVMYTEQGKMEIELYEEDAPLTVENFCKLAQNGFYNGLTFHRVISGFIAQTGCPKGDGTGGPGYFIKDELGGKKQEHAQGVLSMAKCGPNTAGSQFFICMNQRHTAKLDGNHTCFGKVTRGIEFIDNIQEGDRLDHIEIIETDAPQGN